MAVKDDNLYCETTALIAPKPKYYRASIHTSHWQLRSLVSSPEQDLVYYPSGSEIYVLNAQTCERELITTLQFPPRCLTVVGSWLCIGGDMGRFAVVNLREGRAGYQLPSIAGSVHDPDARLPLDLTPLRRSVTRDTASYLRQFQLTRFPVVAQEKKLGSELLNCITIWYPGQDNAEEAYQTPVAIVAGNDCTVTILDLENSCEVLDKLDFPDFVNRSTMSPDGRILVTICDDPYLYIQKREPKSQPNPGKERDSVSTEYKWSQQGRLQLTGQRSADKSNMRGSFAATFSTSGKYLAIATQYGVISVFEVQSLFDYAVEPVVILSSTKPGSESSAIRDMEFSPGPYDLLAWTESSGRFSVADVRNLFLSRQHVTLDPRTEDVQRILVTDLASDPALNPRIVSQADSASSDNSTPDYLGLDLDRRQLGQLSRLMMERQQTPLTAEELEVLTASTLARRQRDEAANSLNSVSNANPPGAETTTGAPDDTSSGIARRTQTPGLAATPRDSAGYERTMAATFRSFINEMNQERERRSQRQEPRRQSSAILTAAAEPPTSDLEAQVRGESSLDQLLLSGPRLLESNTTGSSGGGNNPWSDANPSYRSRFLMNAHLDRSTRLRIEIEDDNRREFAHRLRQPWRSHDRLDTGAASGTGEVGGAGTRGAVRSGPLETMGCCWSPDGRYLYIAAVDGIREYSVNISARKKFPSLVLR